MEMVLASPSSYFSLAGNNVSLQFLGAELR